MQTIEYGRPDGCLSLRRHCAGDLPLLDTRHVFQVQETTPGSNRQAQRTEFAWTSAGLDLRPPPSDN